MSKDKVKSVVGEKSSIPKYEGYLPYEYVENNIKHLSGKILTIIDGAIVNEIQNKAVKDQIKNQIQEILYGFQFYAFKQSDGITQSQGHSVQL